ncbi:MAG: hypothetical protein WC522_03540 [Candidatus Omnitrophota bacterium]
MRRAKVLIGIVLVLMMAALPLLLTGTAHAENDGGDQSDTIINKLNQILDSQKAIAGEVASMRQELNVVKIRVTQSQ